MLCLGESTTYRQWPLFLQPALDRQNVGLTFRVIDDGLPGVHTGIILARLAGVLERYRPHIVVAMVGVNDHAGVWKSVFGFREGTPLAWIEASVRDLRLVKLIKSIRTGLVRRAAESGLEEAIQESQDGRLPGVPSVDEPKNYRLELGLRGDDMRSREMYAADRLRALRAARGSGDVSPSWRLLEEADEFSRRGRHSRARARYKKAIKADPRNPWSYFDLANDYRDNRGLYDRAIDICRKGIAQAPGNPEGYFLLGDLYRDAGFFSKAEAAFREGIRLSPADPRGLATLGDLYHYQIKDYRKALAAYASAVRAAPDQVVYYSDLANLYHQTGGVAKAVDTLQAAIRAAPLDPEPLIQLADLHDHLGEHANAETLLRTALALDNDERTGVRERLGEFYRRTGMVKKAQDLLGEDRRHDAAKYVLRGQVIDPMDTDSLIRACRFFQQAGKYREAEALCRKRIVAQPFGLAAYLELARLWRERGRNDEAEDVRRSYREAKREQAEGGYFSAGTWRNYRSIRDIVLERGTKFVAVQYPLRFVDPLKENLDNGRVIFVENRQNFEARVWDDGFESVFVDDMAGDFGHCTETGNRLIAEAVAKEIIEGGLGKKFAPPSTLGVSGSRGRQAS